MNKETLLTNLTEKQRQYDFSLIEEVFKYNTTLEVICHSKDVLGREHGVFKTTYGHILRGDGCPKCNGKHMDKELFVHEANLIHKSHYSYDGSVFLGKKKKMQIYCNIHKMYFPQTPEKHLLGQGCPLCRYEKSSKTKMKPLKKLIEQSNIIHNGKYDFSKAVYKGNKMPLTLICHEKYENGVEHGEFEITSANLLHKTNPQGCPICGRISSALARVKSFEEFEKESNAIHNHKYKYIKETYVNASNIVDIICPIHGWFPQKGTDHTCLKQGCPKCSNQMSIAEDEIVEYLKTILPNEVIEQRNRILIAPQEVDILLPNKSIAIEFNGLIWHSNKFGKDKNYHINKTVQCKEKGINLIQIFEDEWLFRKEAVKSQLKHILSVPHITIDSNKCIVKNVQVKDAKSFISENSLESYHNAVYRCGLYYDDELLAILGIKNYNKAENSYMITNYAIKDGYNINGGLRKLINHIVITHKPSSLNAYIDKRWNNSSDFTDVNFNYAKDTKPTYYYVNGKRRTLSKSQCGEQYKIYDCGKELYVLEV